MQRVYPTKLSPEEYVQRSAHRVVKPEAACPCCKGACGMYRHGTYTRGVTRATGEILAIAIPRFRCRSCLATISYLPNFALTHKVVAAATAEAFFDGHLHRPDVQRWIHVLGAYQRQMSERAASLLRLIAKAFGACAPSAEKFWTWVMSVCGTFGSAAMWLIARFGVTPFGRYRCHQRPQR